ncbi:sulfatase-like hydrolase/transferase [Cognatishimia sp. SS12]|uniref:sulfatase-like hydrolase/transferase n=1 Tax=Cognatishimia sp. SS12 TaxID=2979465 RepID=UPI00232FE49C|nr:sulfatase-like hydrolase/transferase [Cognatishimia sp. SS12]MDC0739546.1 sulfatase-like hydrolase/transferase [Cognatishimia sp. SS12]
MAKNVLFIMCDQLRYDYLGCAGHPTIRTPNIDALAARGVRFSRSYVQSPICGPSRMSTYTGRYVRSHGADYNNVPLRVGEWTLGDHLKSSGARAVLCGKTHAKADIEGMERLGIDPSSPKGKHIAEAGFEVWDRLDGLHPKNLKTPSHYNDYLRSKGFDGDTPWQDWAASVVDHDGSVKNGWLNEYADRPARIPEEHSETAYSTNRAMEFIEQAEGDPWCLHLSYIKPHWPIVAPAPYHNMYGPEDVVPVVRAEHEKTEAHPVYQSNQNARFSTIYNRDGAREKVVAAYMGLITQIDDHIGRLMNWLDNTGRSKDTLIIFTSDHGDYLGDHWMGEKLYFHDPSVRVPLIVVDPSPKADKARGTVDDRLTESIDLVPTIVDYMGGEIRDHILEGRSLLPLIHGEDVTWKGCVFSEADYGRSAARTKLDRPTDHCRMVMAFDGRWKYVHSEGLRPMLFDLENDPEEMNDLGQHTYYEDIRQKMKDHVLDWAYGGKNRITQTNAFIEAKKPEFKKGVLIGFWDEEELDAAWRAS